MSKLRLHAGTEPIPPGALTSGARTPPPSRRARRRPDLASLPRARGRASGRRRTRRPSRARRGSSAACARRPARARDRARPSARRRRATACATRAGSYSQRRSSMILCSRPLHRMPFSFEPVPVVHLAPKLTPSSTPSAQPVATPQFQNERYGQMPRPQSCTREAAARIERVAAVAGAHLAFARQRGVLRVALEARRASTARRRSGSRGPAAAAPRSRRRSRCRRAARPRKRTARSAPSMRLAYSMPPPGKRDARLDLLGQRDAPGQPVRCRPLQCVAVAEVGERERAERRQVDVGERHREDEVRPDPVPEVPALLARPVPRQVGAHQRPAREADRGGIRAVRARRRGRPAP